MSTPFAEPVREHLYFAYGSNLNVADLLARAPGAERDRAAALAGWRLTFRGVANIEPAAERTVFGGLWRIGPAQLRALDRYEGYPDFYTRAAVTVETAAGPAHALTYVMGTRYEGYVGLPSPTYFASIAQGYADWGLPLEELYGALRETGDGHAGVAGYEPDGPKRLRALAG